LTHAAHDIHRLFIINKIAATIPWCLWCSAISVWIWLAIHVLMDVIGWKRWAIILAPAGQNPLLAYLLAPLLIAAFDLAAQALQCPNYYDDLGATFAVGFWRSLGFACVPGRDHICILQQHGSRDSLVRPHHSRVGQDQLWYPVPHSDQPRQPVDPFRSWCPSETDH
jgi:hypothetical protein